MADINKFDFADNIRNNLGISNTETPINKLAHYIQPTYESIKWANVVKQTSSSNASAIVYTTPANQDFYLVSFQWFGEVDAAATATQAYLTCVVNGATVFISAIRRPAAGTAYSWMTSLSLPYPLKVDRGSTITISQNSVAAGNITQSASIVGVLI